jgi:hypothetical protein
MHVENEFGDQEYEDFIEEYEEEILVPEEISEPSLTDFTDTPPAQGKPRCITLILQIVIYIYKCCALKLQEFMIPTCIYIYIYP